MPKVNARCELMDNAFPAGPLKLRGSFFVVQDKAGENMIFSVDDFGLLRLIARGEDGNNVLIDLSAKFGLSDGESVTALAVNQNRDGTIHLVFAARQTDGASMLFVVEPMTADREAWSTSSSLNDKLYQGEQWSVNIHEFMLGSSDDSKAPQTAYPHMYMVFNHMEKTTEDIWALSIDATKRTWTRERNFQLPTNPINILDRCPANIQMYRGLFVLYKESASLQLRFVGLNPTKVNPTLTSIVQPVPEGASKLASFENKAGLTDLLISGTQDVTYRTALQCFKGDKSLGKVVAQDPSYTDPVQMYVAQIKEHLTVWTLSRQNALSYQEFSAPEDTTEAPSQITPVVPLLDRLFGGGRFAALRNSVLGQKLFVIDDTGVMKMLTQSLESGIWQQPVDIMIPDSDKMIEFSSYTIHVAFEGDDGAPMVRQPVNLASSASAEIIINGLFVRTLPETTQTVFTDEEGTLTIIIRNDSLSAPIITLSSPNPEKPIFSGGELVIDPMSKLWSTVGTISSGKELKNMKMPDGSSFVRADASDDELDQAAKALKDLHQVKKGWTYVVNKLKQGWEFVLEMAGKVWKLVLENLPQVAAAIQAVLSAVTKGWEWIKQKIAFIFSWDDILATKNVLVNLTTQGILFVADSATFLELKAQDFFEEMREKVRELKKLSLPPEIRKLRAGKDEGMENQAKAASGADAEKMKEADEESKSPQSQFASYHVKHSGGTSIGARTEGQTTFDRVWLRLKTIWDEVERLVSRLGDNIKELFTNSSENLSIGDLIANMGFDLLDDFLGVIESLITAILGTLSDIVLELADTLNEPIQIPVLSALYKKLTRGSDLTILDAICLVMAVPTTIVYKIAVGKSPTEIEGIESLTKQGAMRAELDERMGRIREDQQNGPVEAAPPTHFSAMAIAPQPSFAASMRMEAIALPINSVSDDDNKKDEVFVADAETEKTSVDTSSLCPEPEADLGPVVAQLETKSFGIMSSPEVPLPQSNKQEQVPAPNPEAEKQKLALEKSRKKFNKDMNVAEKLLKVFIPSGTLAVYNTFSWPSIFTPEKTGKSRFVSPTCKLVVWLLQFGQLVNFKEAPDIFSKFDEPGVLTRFLTWMVGGAPVLCGFVSKMLGNVMGLIMGFVQVVLLAWTQIEIGIAEEGYSVYLAFEEWAKCIGKLLTCGAGVIKGPKQLPLAVVACLVSNGGTAMQFSRGLAEVTGKTKALYTGMDLGA